MATSTTRTNKPILPRGNDQSPLAYNRAKLYSGKALDFDGVNDSIDISNFSLNGYTAFSICFHKTDDFNNAMIFSSADGLSDGVNIYQVSPGYFRARLNGSNTDTDLEVSTKSGFFVLTYDGSNLNWYYEAQNIGSGTTSQTFAITNTTSTIGRQSYAAAQYLNGQIAGFKIFNTALTAAQVADLYNNPEKVVPTGVDNTALKLWLPMMEGAGTKCLDGASLHTATERVENGDFSDGTTGWVGNPQTTLSVTNGQLDIQSINAQSQYGAAFSEVNFTSGKYYLIQLDVISCDVPTQIRIGGTAIAVSYATNIWNSGEIGVGTHSILWLAPSDYTYLSIGGRNDVTTLVIDNVSVKEVSVGAISGATWTHGIGSPVAQTSVIDWNKRILDKTNEFLIPQGLTAGRDLLGNLFENVRKQGALNLDGNSWAEVHDNGSLDFGTGSFSLEAWAKFSYVSQGSSLNAILTLGGDVGESNQGRAGLVSLSNSKMSFYYNASSHSSTSTFSDGDWVHLVGVYDETNAIVYINGAEESTTARAASSITNTDIKMIGRDSIATRYYHDQIAQPRIYNRALTAEEVQRNYNAGKNIYK